eukprot:8665933-Prorocentrum_lima.AAC.1
MCIRDSFGHIKFEEPVLLVGSLPCTTFSLLYYNMSRKRRDPSVTASEEAEGVHHMKVAARAYRVQLDAG